MRIKKPHCQHYLTIYEANTNFVQGEGAGHIRKGKNHYYIEMILLQKHQQNIKTFSQFTAPLETILYFRKKHAHCIVIHNLSSFFSFQFLKGTYDIQHLTKEKK